MSEVVTPTPPPVNDLKHHIICPPSFSNSQQSGHKKVNSDKYYINCGPPQPPKKFYKLPIMKMVMAFTKMENLK